MAEWQLLDSNNFPETPGDETPARSGSWRRWLFLIGGIALFLAGVGFFTLRHYRSQAQAALRADISAFIFEEETRRHLGHMDEALIMPDLPPAWVDAYRQTFATGRPIPPPDAIQLTGIEFDGQCALVTLTLEANQQIRAYCLRGGQWRRAPVLAAAWGHEQPPLELPGQLRLRFQGRDQAFAEALIADLADFLEETDRLLGRPTSLTGPVEIILEPHDLQGPLLLAEAGRIVLNSPWLAAPAEPGLSGEAAVRLALGKALLQHRNFGQLKPNPLLPGSNRFVEAAQTVLAMHLLLSPEAQKRLAEDWRTRLEGRWTSPFFAELLFSQTPTATLRAETAAHVMADHIYRSGGPEALALALQHLPEARASDPIFQTILQRPTIELENEAAVYAQATPEKGFLRPADYPPLPLVATFLYSRKLISDSLRVYVSLPEVSGQVAVEIPAEMAFQAGDGGALAPGCLGPGTALKISGNWLEIPHRLQASQVEVQDVRPLAMPTAPADTVAYLTAGPSYEPQALMALRANGELVLLTPMSSTLQIFPLPVAETRKEVHFLIRLDLPACNGVWFAHYEPDQGITGQWLAPPEPLQWVWRADKEDLIFFSTRDNNSTYDIYITDGDHILETRGRLTDLPPAFAGWHLETDQLIYYTFDFGATAFGLFDLTSGDSTLQSPYLLLRGRRLSPDGNWLAFLTSGRRPDLPPDRLELIDLTKGSFTILLRVRLHEGLLAPVWSLYMAQSRLAILAGPISDFEETPTPTQLFLFSPDPQTPPLMLAQAADGEELASPVFCADGSLLYLARAPGSYRLLRQAPDQASETLFEADQPFHPLACP